MVTWNSDYDYGLLIKFFVAALQVVRCTVQIKYIGQVIIKISGINNVKHVSKEILKYDLFLTKFCSPKYNLSP